MDLSSRSAGDSTTAGREVALNRPKFCSMWPMFETRRPTNTLWYFLFVRICLTSDRPGALIRRAPEVGGQALQKTLAAFVFIVQNESCLPLKDSPCHHTRSGRDWPDLWAYRKVRLRQSPCPIGVLSPLFFEGLAQEFEIVSSADENVFHQGMVFVAHGQYRPVRLQLNCPVVHRG